MPLVTETKIADVGKLISLVNLLARKTTCLMFTTSSSTSNFFPRFGAYCRTRIIYKYSHLQTFSLFHISLTGSFQCNFLREHSHSLNFDLQCQHTLPLFKFDFQQSTAKKTYTPFNHSHPCHTFRLYFFSLQHRNFVKPQKETNSRNT